VQGQVQQRDHPARRCSWIDAAIAAAETKMVMPQRPLLIDRPGTLEAIARAEAAPLRLALVNAATVAAEVTRSMFDLMTTTAIKTDSVFAQLTADASVAKTHVVHSHRNRAPLGARLSGRPVEGPTGEGPTVFI
jgi:hypothetical protein